jgi:hypothetical protein
MARRAGPPAGAASDGGKDRVIEVASRRIGATTARVSGPGQEPVVEAARRFIAICRPSMLSASAACSCFSRRIGAADVTESGAGTPQPP